jgi:hypothetical protein
MAGWHWYSLRLDEPAGQMFYSRSALVNVDCRRRKGSAVSLSHSGCVIRCLGGTREVDYTCSKLAPNAFSSQPGKGHVVSKRENDADNAFRPSDSPLTQYERKQIALRKNLERLKAERLAREAAITIIHTNQSKDCRPRRWPIAQSRSPLPRRASGVRELTSEGHRVLADNPGTLPAQPFAAKPKNLRALETDSETWSWTV